MDAGGHVPVMAGRVTDLLAPALAHEGAVLVDATLGRAGHARALLDACPGMVLIGVDADLAAIEAARDLLAPYAARVTLVHARYDEYFKRIHPNHARIHANPGHRPGRGAWGAGSPPDAGGSGGVVPPRVQIHSILFDLGVSSPQLDEADRGFAYARDAPLDMRMDQTAARSAADIVNGYPAAELARVLREYGEERFARRIADAIISERSREPIRSTARLSAIVRDAIPAATRRTGGNPAKRTFQALRIEVNDELGTLRRALPAALGLLAVGGRIAVLAYHSLEDRIVKRELVARATDQTPPGLPVSIGKPELRLLIRGAERPGEAEIAANPRAASARLRAAERTREAA